MVFSKEKCIERINNFQKRRKTEILKLISEFREGHNYLSPQSMNKHSHLREQRYLRALPFPFSFMFSITSDIDCSNKKLYNLYMTQLVMDNGLDFGDSVWLSHSQSGESEGIAFFGYDFKWNQDLIISRREIDMTPYEIAKEFHRGNIDHWHMFLQKGPQVIISEKFHLNGNEVIFSFPPERKKNLTGQYVFNKNPFLTRPFAVLGVQICCKTQDIPEEVELYFEHKRERKRLLYQKETDTERYPFLKESFNDAKLFLFKIIFEPDSNIIIPQAHEVLEVKVRFSSIESANIKNEDIKCCLLNSHSEIIINRMRILRDDFGIIMKLVTCHSRRHVLLPILEKEVNKLMMEKYKYESSDTTNSDSIKGLLYAMIGSISEKSLIFSTSMNNELSFVNIFSELRRDFSFTFYRVNPISHSLIDKDNRTNFPDIDNLVYPIYLGNSQFLFNLSITRGEILPDYILNDEIFLNKSTAASFCARMNYIKKAFETIEEEDPLYYKGLGIFFHTHLGNLRPFKQPSKPYLDPTILRFYSDSHYGRGGNSLKRIWFTRASVLADFAVVNQALLDLSSVDFENSIVHIYSADDPLTKKRIPESSRQLYGQTFFIKNPATAKVFLDGKEIQNLQRNLKNEIDPYHSITIAECGIICSIFDGSNPLQNKIKSQNLKATYLTEKIDRNPEYFLRLSFQNSKPSIFRRIFAKKNTDRIGKLSIVNKSSLYLDAAQYLYFSVRRSSTQLYFGLEWQVETGGLFFFGERNVIENYEKYSACYILDDRYPLSSDLWIRYCIPFFDLTWSTKEMRLTLPNHPIKKISFIINASHNDYLDIKDLEVGRPRTTLSICGENKAIIGGVASKQVASIILQNIHTNSEFRTRTDSFSGFRIAGVPYGPYKITGFNTNGIEVVCKVVEVKSDTFDIVL